MIQDGSLAVVAILCRYIPNRSAEGRDADVGPRFWPRRARLFFLFSYCGRRFCERTTRVESECLLVYYE